MENILELFMFSWSWLVPPACTGYYGSSCFSSRIWEIKENKSTWDLGNFIRQTSPTFHFLHNFLHLTKTSCLYPPGMIVIMEMN